jgi:DMSO/TMAO reductase YedYZ molybdopterin-dependent catalytic subunit
VVGIVAQRHRAAAVVGAVLFGAAGATAALSRPSGRWYDVVPSLIGAAVAGLVLWWPRLRGVPGSIDRRRFLRTAGLLAVGAVLAEGGAQAVKRTRSGSADQARQSLKLPAPADPAPPLPPGAGTGFVTANQDFYRVDTALTVPRIDPGSWSLRVHGMVDHPMRLTLDDLLRRPLIERYITLSCVSNEVGGPYLGTARWLGVPLAPLLREMGVQAGADQFVARSVDGMTIGTPVATLLDGRDAMLAVGMNGEPLPLTHGFPVRMLTPGLFGYAGSCKWLTEIELTTFDAFDAYWVERGWAPDGPVKTASRIDRPKPFGRPAAGPVTVAGVAWAQHRGISKVEVRVDGGDWAPAELLPVPSTDTWVQWRYTWKASPGPHSLSVRATDSTGAVQPEQRATPFPSGATGWHTITVTVG